MIPAAQIIKLKLTTLAVLYTEMVHFSYSTHYFQNSCNCG